MDVKMKTNFVAIVLLSFLCFSTTAAPAQKKETLEELSNRVKILEGQKEYLEKQVEFWQEKFETKSKEIDNQFLSREKEMRLVEENIRMDQRKSNWIVGIISILGLGSFIGGWFLVTKFILNKIKEKSEKLINEIYKEKERELLEMARKQNEEFQLKETKSILVISKNPNDNPFLERFFNEMGFLKVKYETLDRVKDPDKYDLLIFDNENLNIDHADLLAIMAKTKPENFCLYFGSDKFDAKEFKDRVNFANSRVQLYGNLVNSLRYQSLLK